MPSSRGTGRPSRTRVAIPFSTTHRGSPGAGPPRWRTRTRRPAGCGSTSHRARPKDQSRPPSAVRRPGTRMAWLATGSYQSKPTASSARARGDACTAATTRRGARRRVEAAQAGPGAAPVPARAPRRRATRRRRTGGWPPPRRGAAGRRRRGPPGARPRSGRRRSGPPRSSRSCEQVEQHAVELVDRRRARVDGHLGAGLHGGDGIGRQHVRGEEVVEHAEGVGDGHAPARAGTPPRSSP